MTEALDVEITLEQIDLLRKRANVGYKEAKEALERCGGNIVEALASLEEENKLKPEKIHLGQPSFFQKAKNIVEKLNRISFTISRDQKTILDIPLTIALVLAVAAMPLLAAMLLLAMLTGCKIRFHKSGTEFRINQNIENISNTVSNLTSKVAQEIKKA